MPSSDGAAKANAIQREKYGDGYSAEMRRRGAMAKNRGSGNRVKYFGSKRALSQEMSRRAKVRWANAKAKETAESQEDVGRQDAAQSQQAA